MAPPWTLDNDAGIDDDDCDQTNHENDNGEQDMGLPADLARVDGAMRWGHNDKTYFFSGKI